MDLELTTQPEVTALPDSKVARFKAALERKRYTLYPDAGPEGMQWWTFCPGHESTGAHEPSLHVTFTDLGGDTEEITTWCFLCRESFYEALMFGHADECTAVYRVKEKNKNGKTYGHGAVISAWEIHSEADYHKYCEQVARESHGGLYVASWWDYNAGDFRKVKWSNGDYIWLRRSEWQEGSYLPGLKGRADEVELYGANAIDESVEVVYCVEGEKDVDTLASIGLTAVSYHTVGKRAGKWNQCVSGRNVVVLGDNDRTGLDYVAAVCEELGASRAAAVCELGVLDGGKAGSGYDVSDWVADGGTRVALEGMVTARGFEPVAVIAEPESNASGSVVDEAPVMSAAERSRAEHVEKEAIKHALHLESTERGRILFNELKSKKDTRLDIAALLCADRPAATVGRLESGQGLFYAGTYNGIFGATGHGKSWFGLMCLAQELLGGNHGVFFTYELPGVVVVDRLRTLGVPDDVMVERLHLYDDKTTTGGDALKGIMEVTGGVAPTFVLLDSIRELLGARGVNGYQETDISQYVIVGMSDPFTRLGAAFVSIDHVGHENKERQSGSAAKNAVVQGALYAVNEKVSVPFRAGNRGYVGFELKKDNMSGLPWDRDKVAFYLNVDIVMDGNGVGSEFTLSERHLNLTVLEKVTAATDGDPVAVNELQEKIISIVKADGGLSQTEIAKLTGKREAMAKAMIRQLVADGVLRVETNNNAHHHFINDIPSWRGDVLPDGPTDWPEMGSADG